MVKFREKNKAKVPYFVVMVDHAKRKKNSTVIKTKNKTVYG